MPDERVADSRLLISISTADLATQFNGGVGCGDGKNGSTPSLRKSCISGPSLTRQSNWANSHVGAAAGRVNQTRG